MIPATTRKEGFHYVGKYWYYSKVKDLGDTNYLGHKNFTVLKPEQEEDFEMNCDAGDIRVGFETERMPNEITIVGIQVSSKLNYCLLYRMIIVLCLFERMEKLHIFFLINILNQMTFFPILKRRME